MLFAMNTVAQGQNHKPECTFYDTTSLLKLPPSILMLFSIYSTQCAPSPHVYIHISISVHKCPSPHSMKGMLIGLSYAVRGISELYAAILVGYSIRQNLQSFLSCGMEYYLVNIVVCVVGVAIYVGVARMYKLRESDEACHVRRFLKNSTPKNQNKIIVVVFNETLELFNTQLFDRNTKI